MDMICYSLMGTKSKRRMTKRYNKGRWGKGRTYRYRPQRRLIQRLAYELGWTESQVREQIAKERLYLLREMYGTNEISEGDI